MVKLLLLVSTLLLLASESAPAQNPGVQFHSLDEILDVIPKDLKLMTDGRPNAPAMTLAAEALNTKAASHLATVRVRVDNVAKTTSDLKCYARGLIVTQLDSDHKRGGLSLEVSFTAFFPETEAAQLLNLKRGGEATLTGLVANAGCLAKKGKNQVRIWIDMAECSLGTEFRASTPPTKIGMKDNPNFVPAAPPGSSAAPAAPPAMVIYKPDQSPIDILKEQGPNISAWVSSTLDVPIPEAIWENVTFLKEALRDEAASAKPRANAATYGFALRLCAIILDDLAERKVVLIKAGGDGALHQGSQLTQNRRDHLTWPMYALERDERDERGERKQWAAQHARELTNWAIRTNAMRSDLGVWYDKFREGLRQGAPR